MLKIKPVPVPAGCVHPKVNDILPCHEFTMGIIAPKGAGKTTTICNLLDFYKGYFHRIIIFSPTIDSDEKWDWIKDKKLLARNTRLEDLVKRIRLTKKKNQPQGIVDNPPNENPEEDEIIELPESFDPIIPESDFHTSYSDECLEELMESQKKVIGFLKKHGYPKYLANRILCIFDDQVGSALFRGKRGSYFTGLNTRHRHYSASFIMVSQGYKEIPKTVRTQWSCLIVFEIGLLLN